MPKITTQKAIGSGYKLSTKLNTTSDKDSVGSDQWRYISDVCEVLIGKWQTRQGNDRFNLPVGSR